MKPMVENARVEWHGASFTYASVCLAFERNGTRYHAWLDRDTGKVDSALYQKPPLGAGTRQLDPNESRNAALIDAAFSAANAAGMGFVETREAFCNQLQRKARERDAAEKAARDTARLRSLMEMSAHDLRAEYLAACESFADIDDREAFARAESYVNMVAAIFKHRFPEADIESSAGRAMTREEVTAELAALTERADALACTLSESPLVMAEDRAAIDDIACRMRRILRNL